MTFHRRALFRGAALGIGGAYLSSFFRQLDAAETAVQPPLRVLFFVQGNGLYPAEIQPVGIDRTKQPNHIDDRSLADHELPMSLQPLAPWSKQLSMIHGLSGRVARGSHNMGFAALGCWPMRKKAYGETIDAALARNLGGIFPHVGLGSSNRGGSLTYNVTSARRGKALPTILNPLIALNQYFGAGGQGAARREFDADTSLLDFMAEDVKRVQQRLNSVERAKLDRYLEAFESMSGRQSKLATLADRIAANTPTLAPDLGLIVETKNGPTGVFDRLDAQFDIAAGAMAAGLTNVATVSAGAGPDRIGLSCMAEELGGAKGNGYIGSHAIGHGATQAGMTSQECHAFIRRRCLQSLARFLKRLESIPDGDGTMLDQTLVVYLSDSAEGHHPVCEEWPVVTIGNLGGRLTLGERFLRYPWYGQPGHRTLANFYLSLLHAVGERKPTFGVPDIALADLDQTGPLIEIMA